MPARLTPMPAFNGTQYLYDNDLSLPIVGKDSRSVGHSTQFNGVTTLVLSANYLVVILSFTHSMDVKKFHRLCV